MARPPGAKGELPGGTCDHCGGAVGGGGDALRCACGSLLARRVAGGIELKCRRCKRTVVIPIETREVSETR